LACANAIHDFGDGFQAYYDDKDVGAGTSHIGFGDISRGDTLAEMLRRLGTRSFEWRIPIDTWAFIYDAERSTEIEENASRSQPEA